MPARLPASTRLVPAMPLEIYRRVTAGVLLAFASLTIANLANSSVAAAPAIDYARDVQPILARRCFACHGPDESEGGIAFHDAALAMVEAESGDYAIVAGDSEASTLIARITTEDAYEQMPPEGDRLSDEEVATIRSWIDGGAEFSRHWSFEPLGDPAVPSGDFDSFGTSDSPIHPIDAFVWKRLADAGLRQAPPADRQTLIRRATYDLTGLPPTNEEVAAFVGDSDPLAYEKLIDRLLASPHYGERWARHWLDLVRYAETNSYERDGLKPNAWKFRDYVIRSFNNDKPYNTFVREQLAGDMLDEVTTETLTATGFYRLGIWDDEPADPLQARYDELDDLVTTTSQAFLGLTINCARCHDHKIDPIPATDYYGMLAFFADVSSYGTRGNQLGMNQIDVSSLELNQQYQDLDSREKELGDQRRVIEQAGIAKMSAPDQRATEGNLRDRNRVLKEKLDQHLTQTQRDDYHRLGKQLKELQRERKLLPKRETVLGLAERRKVEETFVLFRGNPHSPTDLVKPQFPDLFGEPIPDVGEDDRRLALADWITDPRNRLTSRVIVNRIWQHHFGRGIVRSPNNFGQLGTPPTHPELLDYLANQFVARGWKMKEMHRFIMTSQTYRATAIADAVNDFADTSSDPMTIDPGNDLFWRFDPRRLDAEEVRDSILAVSGTLNPTTYGESFYEKLSPEVLAGQSKPGAGWGNSSEEQRNRRSVYIHVKRSLLTPMLSAFDFPEPDTTCEARFATLQPGQAMALLNSDFIHEKSRQLVESVRLELQESSESIDRSSLVGAIVDRVLRRGATSEEIDQGVNLIAELTEQFGISQPRAEELFALSVMNWNEFVFLF